MLKITLKTIWKATGRAPGIGGTGMVKPDEAGVKTPGNAAKRPVTIGKTLETDVKRLETVARITAITEGTGVTTAGIFGVTGGTDLTAAEITSVSGNTGVSTASIFRIIGDFGSSTEDIIGITTGDGAITKGIFEPIMVFGGTTNAIFHQGRVFVIALLSNTTAMGMRAGITK